MTCPDGPRKFVFFGKRFLEKFPPFFRDCVFLSHFNIFSVFYIIFLLDFKDILSYS